MTPSNHAALRRQFVLFSLDGDFLSALLRPEGFEAEETRAKLARVGFEPDAAPLARSIHYRCRAEDLEGLAERVHDAFGDTAVLDLGMTASRELPRWWKGRFVVHAGLTSRAVLFEPSVDPASLAGLLQRETDDFYEHEFRPATE